MSGNPCGLPVWVWSLAAAFGAVRDASAQAQWTLSEDFTSRFDSAGVFDAARGETIVFGGNDGELRNDTWRWDGTTFIRLDPAHRPAPRDAHVMAYDSLRQRVLLFGGNLGAAAPNELWSWNGSDWSQLATANVPNPTGTMAMTYDAARDRVVLVSGEASSFLSVWEFDGTDWSAIAVQPANWPTVQTSWVFAFDGTANNCAFFRTGPGARMWRWNGSAWTSQVSSSTQLLVGARMLHDPLGQRLLLLPGQTAGSGSQASLYQWLPATASWQALSTAGPVTSRHVAAFDAARNRVVVVGGLRPGTQTDSSVWEWDGAQWLRRTFAPPSSRLTPGVAIDLAHDRLVLYGGNGIGVLGDTWVRGQGQWQLLVPQPGTPSGTHPGPLSRPYLVHDAARDETLLLLDYQTASPFWRLVGNQWQPIAVPTPPARDGAAFCYDRRRQRMLLFGGSPFPFRNDLWSWDGVAWTQLSPSTSPQGRTGAAMAYDPLRDRVVLFGGVVIGGVPTDTWEFDGDDWHQSPSGAAPAGTVMLGYDEARQAVVAVTSGQSSTWRTWQWLGGPWLEIAQSTTPQRTSGTLAGTAEELLCIGGGLGSMRHAAIARLRTAAPALLEPFGSGGASSAGPLTLSGTGPLPWLDTTLPLRLSPLPAIVLPGMYVGFSRTEWLAVPLPIDLGAIGYPGNSLCIAPQVPVPVLDTGTGHAHAQIAVPATAGLIGLELFAQGFLFEPIGGAITSSNGVRLVLGAR